MSEEYNHIVTALENKFLQPDARSSLNVWFVRDRDNENRLVEAMAQINRNVAYINMPITQAIKVPHYYEKYIKGKSQEEVRKLLGLSDYNLIDHGGSEQVILTVGWEFWKHDILIVETAGMDYYGMDSLVDICYKLIMQSGYRHIVILIYNEAHPPFEFAEINEYSLELFNKWST